MWTARPGLGAALWFVLQPFLFLALTSFSLKAFPFPLFSFQSLFLPLFGLQLLLFFLLPAVGL
jgi:hypothetical protein